MGASLPPDLDYLPERFRAAGYRTIGAMGNPHLASRFGYGRGYDWYELIPNRDAKRLRSRESGPTALADWDWDSFLRPAMDEAGAAPVFLYLHEVDPHGPYEPPAPFDRLYETGEAGALSSESNTLHRINLGEITPTARDVAHLKSQYRGEIAYMDRFLTRLLERIEADMPGDTITVFVSDHGEEFYERGNMQHWMTLHNESIHVPIILSFPGGRYSGHRVSMGVGLADIAPTLLSACGIDRPAGFTGRDLVPYLEERETDPHPVFAEVLPYIDRIPLTDAVMFEGWKLIRVGRGANARYGLYNLRADPGELHNSWLEESERGATMLRMLDEAQEGFAAPESGDVDALPPEIEEGLRALGYVE